MEALVVLLVTLTLILFVALGLLLFLRYKLRKDPLAVNKLRQRLRSLLSNILANPRQLIRNFRSIRNDASQTTGGTGQSPISAQLTDVRIEDNNEEEVEENNNLEAYISDENPHLPPVNPILFKPNIRTQGFSIRTGYSYLLNSTGSVCIAFLTQIHEALSQKEKGERWTGSTVTREIVLSNQICPAFDLINLLLQLALLAKGETQSQIVDFLHCPVDGDTGEPLLERYQRFVTKFLPSLFAKDCKLGRTTIGIPKFITQASLNRVNKTVIDELRAGPFWALQEVDPSELGLFTKRLIDKAELKDSEFFSALLEESIRPAAPKFDGEVSAFPVVRDLGLIIVQQSEFSLDFGFDNSRIRRNQGLAGGMKGGGEDGENFSADSRLLPITQKEPRQVKSKPQRLPATSTGLFIFKNHSLTDESLKKMTKSTTIAAPSLSIAIKQHEIPFVYIPTSETIRYFHCYYSRESEKPILRANEGQHTVAALEIPLANPGFAIRILMPYACGLFDLTPKQVTYTLLCWDTICKQNSITETKSPPIALPLLSTCTASYHLREMLHSLGVKAAFSPAEAEFDRLCSRDEFSGRPVKPLWIEEMSYFTTLDFAVDLDKYKQGPVIDPGSTSADTIAVKRAFYFAIVCYLPSEVNRKGDGEMINEPNQAVGSGHSISSPTKPRTSPFRGLALPLNFGCITNPAMTYKNYTGKGLN